MLTYGIVFKTILLQKHAINNLYKHKHSAEQYMPYILQYGRCAMSFFKQIGIR